MLSISSLTNSGVTITTEKAMTIAAAYRAISLKAGSLASLPIKIKKKDTSGNFTVINNHPLSRLLNHAPGGAMTHYNLFELFQTSLDLRGNAYAVIRRGPSGFAESLEYVHPDYVYPKVVDNEIIYQVYTPAGGWRVLDYSEVLHFRNLPNDEHHLIGRSTVQLHRENLGLAVSATDYAAHFMNNAAHIPGWIEYPKQLRDPARKNLSDSWRTKHGGLGNAGTIPILEEGAAFHQLTLRPEDAMFLGSYAKTNADIANIFGVPVHMLNTLERSTFNNIEHQGREFVAYTFRPLCGNYQDEMEMKLVPEAEKTSTFIEFDLYDLSKGDMQSRGEYFSKMFSAGALSPNEILRMEGHNTYEGGDQRYIPVNMVPHEMSGQNIQPHKQ